MVRLLPATWTILSRLSMWNNTDAGTPNEQHDDFSLSFEE
jgi:hypothetical protein